MGKAEIANDKQFSVCHNVIKNCLLQMCLLPMFCNILKVKLTLSQIQNCSRRLKTSRQIYIVISKGKYDH